MRLGEIIKKYRADHNMSMDDFSERSGISKSYISLLEKNRHPQTGKPITPSIQYIKQAADGMGMDFNELFSMIEGDVSLIESSPAITPVPVSLSSEEHAVVTGYRAADQPTKTVVKRLLNVEYEEPILNAAHDMGATEEEKQRADDIMMNDDEWK